jgi:hypothetical protein
MPLVQAIAEVVLRLSAVGFMAGNLLAISLVALAVAITLGNTFLAAGRLGRQAVGGHE